MSKVKIPKRWEDVPLENWVALQDTAKEEPKTEYDIVGLQIRRVMLICNCSLEEARGISLEQTQAVTKLIKTPLPTILIKRFKLNGIRYKVETRLHKLPSGKIQELAADARILNAQQLSAAAGTKGKPDRWHQTIMSVCRPLKRKWLFFWTPYDFEAYEIQDRLEDFKKLPLGIAHPIAVFFFSSLESLLKPFARLFNQPDEDDDEEPRRVRRSLTERYGWFPLIDSLAGGDPTKIDHIAKMNSVDFLGLAMYYKDKEMEQRTQREESN